MSGTIYRKLFLHEFRHLHNYINKENSPIYNISQNTRMEELDKQTIKLYANRLEYKLRCSQNTIEEFRNAIRIIMNENESLQNSVHQHKRQIAELVNREIQNRDQEMKKTNVLHKQMDDLLKINQELSREINLNNMTTKMRDVGELRSRS